MQTIPLRPGEHRLDDGTFVLFVPGWLDRNEADGLLRELRAEIPWQQGQITMFGRPIAEPRLTAWFGDADYTYSGRTVRARPWPPSVAGLRDRLERAAGARFNAVLLNLYRDGKDSMGMHADDEPELGPNPIIGSLSLGQERRFVLVPKKKGGERPSYSAELGHGSLLVMAGRCQHAYRHGLPKQPGMTGERINLTFRFIHAARG